jgi:hypothetical protein
MTNTTDQSGGDFLTSVRNLTVPFGILLASKGMQVLNDKKNATKAKPAAKPKSAAKPKAAAKPKPAGKKSKAVQKGGEISFKQLTDSIAQDFKSTMDSISNINTSNRP